MKRFLTDETGVATTDWVILTAMLTGIGVVVAGSLFVGFGTGAQTVGGGLSQVDMPDAMQTQLQAIKAANQSGS